MAERVDVHIGAYDMALRWAVEDFAAVLRHRLARKVNIAREASQIHGAEYFGPYADGLADAVAILEDTLKDWREGRR